MIPSRAIQSRPPSLWPRKKERIDTHQEGEISMLLSSIAADPRKNGHVIDYRACSCPIHKGKSAWSDFAFTVDNDTIFPADVEGGGIIPSVVIGESLQAAIGPEGDVDFIAFTIGAEDVGRTFTVTLRGVGDEALNDPFLEVYRLNTETGLLELIGYDDDGGAGITSLLNFTAAAAGTYFVVASSFSNPGQPGIGDYQVDIRRMPVIDAVPFSFGTNEEIIVGETYFGFTESPSAPSPLGPNNPAGDSDLYKITLEPGKLYSFEAAGGYDYDSTGGPPGNGSPFNREIDTRMFLLDENGFIVAQNDDINFPSDFSSAFTFYTEEGGTFFLAIIPYPGAIGGYTIDVNEVDIASLGSPLDTIDWGTELDPSQLEGGITVYFAQAGETFAGETSLGWTDYEISRAMAAFQTYADVLDISFRVVDNPEEATFKLVALETDEFLGAFFPPDTGPDEGVGLFAVNGEGWDRDGSNGGLEQGGFGFVTLIHEIGHGLGLAHPHDGGGNSTVMPGVSSAFFSFGVFNLNQGIYTTMSYNTGWQTQPGTVFGDPPAFVNTHASEGTPGAFDLAVLQRKYGGNPTTNAGNTTYTLPTLNQPGTFFATIWDTSGIDTIAHDGSGDAIIDLTAATLDYSFTGGGVVSYVDGIFGGYTIANGVVIENASGGSGNDVLIGNDAANRLEGNDGDDVLIGGAGADTLIGGAGFDTVGYQTADSGVTASLASMRGTAGDAAGDRYSDVEALTGSNFDDRLSGGNRNDTIDGLDGDDIISGGNGNDLLSGGDGDDTLEGGNGNDLLAGGDGVDGLDGGNGSDEVDGAGGDDTLDGGNGNDLLNGGAGDDTLIGGNGNDIFLFTETGGEDRIRDFRRGDRIDLSEFGSLTFVGGDSFDGDGDGEVRSYREGGQNFLEGDIDGDGDVDFTILTNVLIRESDLILGGEIVAV